MPEERQGYDVKIDYIIYDMFIPTLPKLTYDIRKVLLEKIFNSFPHLNHVKLVETFKVDNIDDINKYYEQFLHEGYEGAMLRLNQPYRYSNGGYHSRILLKLKPTFDAEFEVIGHSLGEKGKAVEALMFICKTDQGIEFAVTPAMELPARIALAAVMDTIEPNGKTYFENNYLGKKLIVTFDAYSNTKVPQRARTKGVIRTWD